MCVCVCEYIRTHIFFFLSTLTALLNLDAVSVPERDGWMEWRPQGVRQRLRASQVGGRPRTAEVVFVSYSRAESRPGGWGARRTVRRSHRDQQRVRVNSLSLRGGETHLPLPYLLWRPGDVCLSAPILHTHASGGRQEGLQYWLVLWKARVFRHSNKQEMPPPSVISGLQMWIRLPRDPV